MSELITKRSGDKCVRVSLVELLQIASYSKQLKFSDSRIKSTQTGQHLSRLIGRGMEFAESRHYQTGDDIRCIDWRITARTGKPHTKLFTEEKERQILLWVDMRSSMFFATQGVFKSVQASLIASYLAWNAAQTHNRLGGFIFDNHAHYEFRPSLGKKGVLPLLKKLSEFDLSSNKSKPREPIKLMDHAIESIERVVSPGSLIFLISDFKHLSKNSYDLLNRIARHSDLCLCFINDPFEVGLPQDYNYLVTDGRKTKSINKSQIAGLAKYREQFLERKNQLAALSMNQHIHLLEFATIDNCFEILKQNFR